MEKAKYLEDSKDLASVHSEYSVKGQTTVSEADDDVDLHFICFIQKDGDLYELDGRKEFPINHGKCDDLLKVNPFFYFILILYYFLFFLYKIFNL